MFKNRDVDEVSDVDQNDIDKILQDTEDLDNDLFKDINSKSKFGLSKTLPAAILKKPNATASDSQKNISFNFENDNDKLFDGFDSLVKKPLESKPPLQKQSSTRDIFNDISDDLELFNEKKPPKASIPNKPNDSFSKSKSFKEELFGKGSFDEDNANISNDGDLGKSSDDFKFGGYMPSSATSRSFKQSDEKSDFLFDEEPRAQIRPRTSPSAGLSQTQTTTKADTNLLMRTAPVSLQKNSGNKAFDFDFDFDSLVKPKSKDKVQKTSSQATTGQKPDWLMNLNNTSPAKHSNKPIDTSIKSSIKSSFDDDGDNEANIEPLQIESTKTSFKVSENRLESKHKLLDGDEWLDSKKAPSPSKKTNIDATHYDSNEIQSMLQKIKQLEYENQELNMQLSNQKAHYEAQIAILNESHEQRVKMMREDRETLIKHQNEAKQALQAHINTLERQNNEAFTTYKQKLDEREREFEADLDKQRRLHREVAERLKADFTEQIEKLKRQKQVEVDSIMQIGVHSKSIENVVGKIEEQARTLDVMQQRVERGHVSNLVDVENQLKAKEEQLKAQESRLFKQQKEYENEIRLLNDMVQKLENHLAEQTKTASEERWKGKQQEKKMEALQEALMNEQRIVMEKLARERNDIERAKDDILVEQKRLMQQIYEEKRKNAEERANLEASIAAYKDKTHKDSLANISIEAELTVNSKRLKDEKSRLEDINLNLKEREAALRQEKLALDEKKQELEIRAAKIEKMSIDVNHKYLETEELYLKASREKDAQMRYLREANSIKQNHDSRLNQIQAQLSALSQKEVEVNREKIDVYRQRQELEKFKSTLKCNKCQDPIRDFGFLDFKIPLTSTLANTVKYPSQNLLASSIKNSNSNSDLEESKILRQLKLQAFKDKQFLNQEKQFIDTLRSNSGLDANLRSISMNQLNSTFV